MSTQNENVARFARAMFNETFSVIFKHCVKDIVTLDTENLYFDHVDDWKETALGVDHSFNLNSVRDLTQRETPLVLLQKNWDRNKFDHFVNLMQKNVLEKPPSTLKMTNTVFVCLTIIPDSSGKTLFLDDFFQGFLEQDYPQNLMDVLILNSTSMPEEIFSKTSYYRSQCLKINEKVSRWNSNQFCNLFYFWILIHIFNNSQFVQFLPKIKKRHFR